MTTCTPTNQRAHGSHEFLFFSRKSFSHLRPSGANGYPATRHNASINVRVNGNSVDLVSGKRQGSYGKRSQPLPAKGGHVDKIASHGRPRITGGFLLWDGRPLARVFGR
jgi:hypothetical protein